MERRFELPWDRTLRVTTTLYVLLLLGLGLGVGAILLAQADGDPVARLAGLAPLLVMAGAIPLTWALAPRALVVGQGLLRIERPLRPVELPLSEVRVVGRLPREALSGLLRTGGSGGAFGYYGRYWSRRLGAIRLYATRRDEYVLVDTATGRFVVTPDDPDAFVAAVMQGAPRAAPLGSPEALAPAAGGRGVWKTALKVLAGVALLAGGILLVAWGWAPRTVRLDGDAVVVERTWGAPVTIPLPSEPGAVRPLSREELRGFRKVSGTSLGAVRYGRFRSDALGAFQLYAPGRGVHWLLETPEGKVVVVPDDPAAFEAGVRERGSR